MNITNKETTLPLKDKSEVGLRIIPENNPPTIVLATVISRADRRFKVIRTYSTIILANPNFIKGTGRGSRFSNPKIVIANAV